MTESTIASADYVDALKSSPVHGIRPVADEPVWIDIQAIDVDPTNPGSLTASVRYKRRDPSIRDSYDILGRIVYPVVVCQKDGDPTRFIHVDGFGRLQQSKERGETKVRAIVYPPLTLEQRICLRQTLNAAQEPFDVSSIIQDLHELARQRQLDVRNPQHVRTLVRDLPEKVRKHERDLITLARWAPSAAEKLGESYSSTRQAIGIDKIRALTRILDVVGARHPKVMEDEGGELPLSSKLADMYLGGRFSEGSRSQEAIREVVRALKSLPENDAKVAEFFGKRRDYTLLQPYAERLPRPGDIKRACENLTSLLLTVDGQSLADADRRVLRRTLAVLKEVVS